MTVMVPASREVERLIGKRIRVVTTEFDGYGEILSVLNYGDGDLAELELE